MSFGEAFPECFPDPVWTGAGAEIPETPSFIGATVSVVQDDPTSLAFRASDPIAQLQVPPIVEGPDPLEGESGPDRA